MRLSLALLGLFAAVAPAAAEDACAKFNEPLAYNACLAHQGPAARAVHVGKAPVGHRVSGRIVVAPRRGRASMVFSVGK